MRLTLIPFLQTVSATAAAAAGLFFVRFWRQSGDRLFAFFGAAFWVLALSWALLALINPVDETRPYVYAIRLVAFVLMIVGMIDKNREQAD
jgi:hypothetical protein